MNLAPADNLQGDIMWMAESIKIFFRERLEKFEHRTEKFYF